MKNLNTKKVLNILKIILFVCIGSSILVSISNIFEVEFLRKIFGHFDMGFSLTSAILYIYIYKKGYKKIAHIGFALLAANYLFSFLGSFDLFTYSKYYLKEFPSIILYPISSLISSFSSIAYYMALYSLIKTDNQDINQFKKIHIYACIASAVVGIINPLTSSKFILLLSSLLTYCKDLFFGLVLITYFLSKEEDNQFTMNNAMMNQPINNMNQNPNMMNQPMNNMMNNMNQNMNMMNNNMMNNQNMMNNSNMMNNQNNRFM